MMSGPRSWTSWNDTAAALVPELIVARAARTPDAAAVVCGDAVLSYGELAGRAGRLARYLVSQGAGPEQVVGLCLDRGPDMITAIVGVWLAGAAYLPLDPAYPPPRLEYMLAASSAGLVVTRGGLPGGLAVPGTAVVDLADPRVAAAVRQRCRRGVPVVRRAGDQLAYVIFTSGSTGAPKGVGGHAPGAGELPVRGCRPGLGWGALGGRYLLLQAPVTDLGNTVIWWRWAPAGCCVSWRRAGSSTRARWRGTCAGEASIT